jgi:RNA polymerase sigma-32 factor
MIMTKTALIPSLTPDGSLSRYMEQIRQFPMLEPDEEYMLARAFAERGDVASAHKLVTSHLRLVGRLQTSFPKVILG